MKHFMPVLISSIIGTCKRKKKTRKKKRWTIKKTEKWKREMEGCFTLQKGLDLVNCMFIIDDLSNWSFLPFLLNPDHTRSDFKYYSSQNICFILCVILGLG